MMIEIGEKNNHNPNPIKNQPPSLVSVVNRLFSFNFMQKIFSSFNFSSYNQSISFVGASNSLMNSQVYEQQPYSWIPLFSSSSYLSWMRKGVKVFYFCWEITPLINYQWYKDITQLATCNFLELNFQIATLTLRKLPLWVHDLITC